jgi:hypothetical protein
MIKAEGTGMKHMLGQRHAMTKHAVAPSPRRDARVAGLAQLLAAISTREEYA